MGSLCIIFLKMYFYFWVWRCTPGVLALRRLRWFEEEWGSQVHVFVRTHGLVGRNISLRVGFEVLKVQPRSRVSADSLSLSFLSPCPGTKL